MVTGYLPYGAAEAFIETLQTAGCQKIVIAQGNDDNDTLSGVVSKLQQDDVLVLASTEHVKDFLALLVQAGCRRAHVKALAEGIDTHRDTVQFNADTNLRQSQAMLATIA
nr:hypothetical protein [uncultured Dyadobacter sp.]